jgi:DnaJ-domain-containing protein 1
MLIIQTDSTVLSLEWFGNFIMSHSRDTIFLPMSIVIFLDEMLMKDRKDFLIKLAKLYSEKSDLYYEQLLKNLLRYKGKPIKIEFKVEKVISSDVNIYLDAISHSEVKILLQEPNPWIITFFSSQLDRFITEFDDRRLFLNASEDRSKNRLDRVLKKRKFLFFNIKYTYSKNFLTILFNEYTKKRREHNYNRENSFNSSDYHRDSVLLYHYGILELQYNASIEDVKANYRKLAKMYHPDRVHHKNPTIVNLYTKKFQDIQNSYQFLKAHLSN